MSAHVQKPILVRSVFGRFLLKSHNAHESKQTEEKTES